MKNPNSKTSRSRQRKAVARQRLNPTMFIVPKVDGNPRRKGSLGFKSFSIIAGARKPMTVETFANKGGRLRDLHYDLNQGHAKLAKKAS